MLSKTTDEKDFNPKYLSNYLSAKISYSNKNNEDSVKYFNSLKSITENNIFSKSDLIEILWETPRKAFNL